MYHRIGPAAYKSGLDNILAIDEILNHPHREYKTIHIAGTNGKGSVSHMLAAILQNTGYKTGLFTSPHLKDFRERIRVNGKMIPKNFVTAFIKKHRKDFEKINPSFFEWTAGLAFYYFKMQRVDVAVIETGLGGRLDSTNIIRPVLSVITNISYDHQHLLGNTLGEIAREKAGIIKEKIPVIIGETHRMTKPVFVSKAEEVHAPIVFADARFKASKIKTAGKNTYLHVTFRKNKSVVFKDLRLDLAGNYQLKNICTVWQAVERLQGEFHIRKKDAEQALCRVKKLTGLAGRWHILQKKPLVICDTAHNPAGIKFILDQIRETPHRHLHFVLGMVNDKDVGGILSMLPRKNTSYYFCKADIPRGLEAFELQKQAQSFQLNGQVYKSVLAALRSAKKHAGDKDLVFVGGSTFTVAEAV